MSASAPNHTDQQQDHTETETETDGSGRDQRPGLVSSLERNLDELDDSDYRLLAEDLFGELFDARELCPLCFARKRTFYPEYDEILANRLYRGPKNGHRGSNKVTFASMGHSLNSDGTLQVNSATSDADPATYQDVVPETWIDGEWHPSRSKTICECGVIDYDFSDHRSKGQMYDAIENIAGHLEADGYPVDLPVSKALLRHDLRSDSLAGKDREVLIRAIKFGIKYDLDAVEGGSEMHATLSDFATDLDGAGRPFNHSASEELLRQSLRSDKIGCDDREVLIKAIRFGMKHAESDEDGE